jgi:hypothetical protein
MERTGIKTKRAVIEEALKTLVRLKRQEEILSLLASCTGRATSTRCAATVILVDSSVWIDYFNGRGTPQTEQLDALLGGDELLRAHLGLRTL